MHLGSAARLAAFAAALGLVFAAAFAVGAAVAPPPAPAAAHGGGEAAAGHGDGQPEGGHQPAGAGEGGRAGEPGGLATAAGGYRLVPAATTLVPGTTRELAFRILGPDGSPTTRFQREHDRRLHLVVVRRDTTGYQHLHPTMDADGTWRVPLAVAAAGTYRAFADFTPAGGSPTTRFQLEHDRRLHLVVVRRDTTGYQHLHPAMDADGTWRVPLAVAAAGTYRAFADFTPAGGAATTLGVDLFAGGRFQPVAHRPSRQARVDGYQVELAGELVAGRASTLTFTVRRHGRPVTDLDPWLGAYGHLVALRQGDLGFLHTHPQGGPGDGRTPAGPEVVFTAQVPSAGGYRLFLDFRHAGVTRTAAFTVAAGDRP